MMADVKWIKITTDIFDDEKILLIEGLPDSYAIITVWFKLLCLAGKQNNSGVFMMGRIAFTDKMLATIFRMKESTVTMALQIFEQFGMVEIVDGVITIPNWGKHQNLDQLESKKEYMRTYMRDYREKQKALAAGEANDKTNCKTNSKANVSSLDKEGDKEREVKGDEEGENKSKRDSAHFLFERLLPDYIFSEALTDKLKEWIRYKSERKEPYKEQGLKTLLRQIETICNQYGEAAVADLIDDSMANGWKGIIFDRLKRPQQQATKPRSNKSFLDDLEAGKYD